MRREGLFGWDALYGQEYALASLYECPRALFWELARASEGLGRVFARTVAAVQQGDDRLLAELGLPRETFGVVRTPLFSRLATLIGRFDFIQTATGLKMLEFNAETPCAVAEAFYVNERVCRYYGAVNPNAGCGGQLARAFRGAVAAYRRRGYPVKNIVFSSVDWHEEDLGTTLYLLQASGLKARYVPMSQLRVWEDRLQVWENGAHTPVDLLYRLYPLERLVLDRDEDGYPTGIHVLDLIARRRLAVINPPAALIAQSKALQALIWNLFEAGQFFKPEERRCIARYMLPTYLENRFSGCRPYVVKPVLGREGGGVTVFDAAGHMAARDAEDEYWEQPMVYQLRAEGQVIRTETEQGMFAGYPVLGVFLAGGRAAAVMARLGGIITGNMAYFLPLSVKK